MKWTAPEAIHYRKYSVASDVWSYGCLLYEIWSLGYKPFEGLGNVKVSILLHACRLHKMLFFFTWNCICVGSIVSFYCMSTLTKCGIHCRYTPLVQTAPVILC